MQGKQEWLALFFKRGRKEVLPSKRACHFVELRFHFKFPGHPLQPRRCILTMVPNHIPEMTQASQTQLTNRMTNSSFHNSRFRVYIYISIYIEDVIKIDRVMQISLHVYIMRCNATLPLGETFFGLPDFTTVFPINRIEETVQSVSNVPNT